jgi:hypothetical protein
VIRKEREREREREKERERDKGGRTKKRPAEWSQVAASLPQPNATGVFGKSTHSPPSRHALAEPFASVLLHSPLPDRSGLHIVGPFSLPTPQTLLARTRWHRHRWQMVLGGEFIKCFRGLISTNDRACRVHPCVAASMSIRAETAPEAMSPLIHAFLFSALNTPPPPPCATTCTRRAR